MHRINVKSQNKTDSKKQKKTRKPSLFKVVGVVRLELTLSERTRF